MQLSYIHANISNVFLMARWHRLVPPLFKSEIARAYDRDRKTPVAEIAKDFGVSAGYPTQAAKAAGKPLRRPRQAKPDERNDR